MLPKSGMSTKIRCAISFFFQNYCRIDFRYLLSKNRCLLWNFGTTLPSTNVYEIPANVSQDIDLFGLVPVNTLGTLVMTYDTHFLFMIFTSNAVQTFNGKTCLKCRTCNSPLLNNKGVGLYFIRPLPRGFLNLYMFGLLVLVIRPLSEWGHLWFHHVLFLLFLVQNGLLAATFACKSEECLWQDWYIWHNFCTNHTHIWHIQSEYEPIKWNISNSHLIVEHCFL